jgi:lysophospholipid acyltransferase (LPLAT)-like uncharacterized protein
MLKHFVITRLAAVILRLYSKTLRWQFEGFEHLNLARPAIFIFWHGRQIFMPAAYKIAKRHKKQALNFFMLISQHRDGRIAADIAALLGIKSVAGSSTRGGSAAFLALKEALENNNLIGITPDGPKGPIYKLKPGAARLAEQTGVPVYCVSIAANKFWTFKSWDAMQLAKPFSKIVCYISPATTCIPEEDNISKLEDLLNEITVASDNYFNSSALGAVIKE